MKKEKIKCVDCERDDFKSYAGLSNHQNKKHPYVPPPSPEVTTESCPNDEYETLKLINGNYEVGDVFYHIRKFVVRKTTRTEGINTLVVEAECMKRHYQTDKP